MISLNEPTSLLNMEGVTGYRKSCRKSMPTLQQRHWNSINPCVKNAKRNKKDQWQKELLSTKEFSSRGQVDLIDKQAMSSSTQKWIMVYQDHLTKFCVL